MYEKLGCPSIAIGVDLTRKKGLDALSAQQTFWNGQARGLYTEIMREHFDQIWDEHPVNYFYTPIFFHADIFSRQKKRVLHADF